MSNLSDQERYALSLLLPWYANGTLDDADSKKVEAALAEDEALAREFDLVLEDQAAVVELVSEEEVPASISERFKAALHAEEAAQSVVASPAKPAKSGLASWFDSLFEARPRDFAFAAIVMVLFVPAFLYMTGASGPQLTGQYQTASGEDGAASTEGIRMLVKISDDAGFAALNAFLKDNGGQIVKGPSADGFYELEFEPKDGIEGIVQTQTTLFDFALPAN